MNKLEDAIEKMPDEKVPDAKKHVDRNSELSDLKVEVDMGDEIVMIVWMSIKK